VSRALAIVRANWLTALSYRLETMFSFLGLFIAVVPLYFISHALQPMMANSMKEGATDAIGDEPATSSEPEVPLARYMDRKSESQPLSSAAPAAGAAVPAAPARPAFGRKGL